MNICIEPSHPNVLAKESGRRREFDKGSLMFCIASPNPTVCCSENFMKFSTSIRMLPLLVRVDMNKALLDVDGHVSANDVSRTLHASFQAEKNRSSVPAKDVYLLLLQEVI